MPLIPSTPLTATLPALTTSTEVPLVVVGGTFSSTALDYPLLSASVASNCSPFGGATLDILAALTDAGENLIARQMVEGLGYRIVGFRTGRGGYNPGSPLQPTAIDTTATDLEDPYFPTAAAPVETIDRYEQPNDMAAAFLCRVESGESVVGIGEYGIWAEITYSPLVPAEVGTQHLYAIVHRPLFGKTLQDVSLIRLVVQF